jgi:isopentenyl diphosphate isomerase/L-lactate dehydrogenase-like FMN-dependent dehydrogenase
MADETQFWTLHEIIDHARLQLNGNIWDYLAGGAETETTLRRNRLSLDSIAFRPRVLRNVSDVNSTSEFLGSSVRLPVVLAPVGSLVSFHADGRTAAASAAARFGVPIILNNTSVADAETLADVPALKIYQIYPFGDGAWLDEHVHRAMEAGYKAICITIDTAVSGWRERDIVNRFEKPWHKGRRGSEYTASFDWKCVERLRQEHKIAFILKGIATAEDATLAVEAGIDVVYISNHGGRQLDHGRGAIDVLPEVVAAVAGRAKIFIDGGVCRGTDVVKALILGADLVGLGRLYLYGLAAGGAQGVERVLELLEREVQTCLALLGVRELAALEQSMICPAQPTAMPGLNSAYPLLRSRGPWSD